jgi:hypothetical protein
VKYNKYYNFDKLLTTYKYLSFDENTETIIMKEVNNMINQIYFKQGINNGTLLVLTSDKLNNKILESVTDIHYINDIYIITNRTNNLYYHYKIKYLSSKFNNSIILNNIINKSKFDKILISDFAINKKFFLYNELDGSNFFINKARDLCYFDLRQFLQLYGFNEDTNEFIYDFSNRLIRLNYVKNYIKKQFDLSKKENLILNNNLKSWGKESTKTLTKLKKRGKTYIIT